MPPTFPPGIRTALGRVKETLSRKKAKNKKQLLATLDHLSSSLNHLFVSLQDESSLTSEPHLQHVLAAVRLPLHQLYVGCPIQALALADSILSTVTSDKFAVRGGKWIEPLMSIADSLLSGVLDFLDEHPSRKTQEHVASSLFPTVSSFCFPEDNGSLPIQNTVLLCSGFTLLSEATAGHGANQHLLRDSLLFGGHKLGCAISRSKDFLVLESVLTLFARLIPPNDGTSVSQMNRTKYIDTVWSSPNKIIGGLTVSTFLQSVKAQNWDEVPLKIIDLLAKHDITFPQPIALEGFSFCGIDIPRRSAADRLYVEHSGLFFNITTEAGDYESLSIPFSTVKKLSFSSSTKDRDTVRVSIPLSSVPRVAGILDAAHTHLPAEVNFHLRDTVNSHFVGALQSRNLSKLIHHGDTKRKLRISVIESPTRLDFGSPRFLQSTDPKRKLKEVEEFYKTNDNSDEPLADTCKPEDQAVTLQLSGPTISPVRSLSESGSPLSDAPEAPETLESFMTPPSVSPPILPSRAAKPAGRMVIVSDDENAPHIVEPVEEDVSSLPITRSSHSTSRTIQSKGKKTDSIEGKVTEEDTAKSDTFPRNRNTVVSQPDPIVRDTHEDQSRSGKKRGRDAPTREPPAKRQKRQDPPTARQDSNLPVPDIPTAPKAKTKYTSRNKKNHIACPPASPTEVYDDIPKPSATSKARIQPELTKQGRQALQLKTDPDRQIPNHEAAEPRENKRNTDRNTAPLVKPRLQPSGAATPESDVPHTVDEDKDGHGLLSSVINSGVSDGSHRQQQGAAPSLVNSNSVEGIKSSASAGFTSRALEKVDSTPSSPDNYQGSTELVSPEKPTATALDPNLHTRQPTNGPSPNEHGIKVLKQPLAAEEQKYTQQAQGTNIVVSQGPIVNSVDVPTIAPKKLPLPRFSSLQPSEEPIHFLDIPVRPQELYMKQSSSTRLAEPQRSVKATSSDIALGDCTISNHPRQYANEVITVVNCIHEALVQKISGRLEGVRHDVRVNRDRILHDAAASLEEMRQECAGQYNNLIELETQYANCARDIMGGWDHLTQNTDNLSIALQKALRKHDQRTLNKTLPTSLFPSALPSSLRL